MANNSLREMKKSFALAVASGLNAISSDFTLEIEGQEGLWILTKQAPWVIASSAGEIEIAMPNGGARWERQNQKVNFQGPISFYETQSHKIDKAMMDIIGKSGYSGGRFNCKVYHGIPNKHVGGKRYENCFMTIESPDTDWENRSQALMITGTLFGHYFGEDILHTVKTI
ncbi:MAG: hypothetical protein RIR39_2181 [Pseudomonadota bacterium]